VSSRSPWKSQPRDTRAHRLIERYLEGPGADSKYQKTLKIRTHDAANDSRLSVRRGAMHYGVSAAVWVQGPDGAQCRASDCPDPEGIHSVIFSLHTKAAARRHVAKQTGGDPAKLVYNPFRSRG